jgi:signal transduction histidine kinase
MSKRNSRSAAIERRAVAEEVASSFRHDLRNKLAAIRNAAFYIARRTEKTDLWTTDPRVASFFKLIDDQLAEAEQILSDRIPPPRLAADHAATVTLSACVDQALAELAVPSRCDVTMENAGEPLVEGNVDELVLAVRSILENALDAAGPGGRVRIQCLQEGESALLRVTDSGPGLPDEVRQAQGAPFRTTKPGHLGLGLAVAQRAVRRHGGELRFGVARTPGATVELLLPKTRRVAA